jgi:hypothetical protein
MLRIAPGGGSDGGIVFNAVDANNYWVATLSASTLFLYERTNGILIARGSASVSAVNQTRHVLTVDPQGDMLTVYWDGVAVVTYTATNRPHKSGTLAGLLQFPGGTALFDGFEVP